MADYDVRQHYLDLAERLERLAYSLRTLRPDRDLYDILEAAQFLRDNLPIEPTGGNISPPSPSK